MSNTRKQATGLFDQPVGIFIDSLLGRAALCG